LFSSATAWNRVLTPGPTEIGELFVMMLRFVVDRFAHLRQPGQKIQFVQLLIEILDDFRIRCLQVWKSKPAVDNLDFLVAETLGYVHGVLEEWENSPVSKASKHSDSMSNNYKMLSIDNNFLLPVLLQFGFLLGNNSIG